MATTRQDYINAIDATFPVAGADNNSQGFRDNFANIKTALSMSSGGTGGSGGGGTTVLPATPIVSGSVYGLTDNHNTFVGLQAGLTASTSTSGYNNIAVGYQSLYNITPQYGTAAIYSGGGTYGIYDSGFSGSTVISTFPSPIVDAGYRVVTTTGAATVTSLNNPGIATYTGLTNVSEVPTGGNNDDGYWQITLPFSINYLGIAYTVIGVSTNGYVSFGSGNSSIGIPPLPLIAHANGDSSVQRIYHGTEGSTYRIVIEGTNGTSGTLGAPNILTEYIFYQTTPDQIDVIGTLNAYATVLTPATTATFGVSNVAIGAYALHGTTGTMAWSIGNVAIGEYSLYNVGPGSQNVAIGTQALFCSVTGYNNIAIGQCTLYNATCYGGTIASNNIAVGQNAMLCMTDANNIAIGTRAFNTATYGASNVMIGQCAGCSITYGSDNTIIGNWSGPVGSLYGTVAIYAGTCNRIKVDNNGLCINGAPLSTTPSINSNQNFAIACTGGTGLPWRTNFGNGTNNVSIGNGALCNNYISNNNLAIGANALFCNYYGSNNFAQGYRAMCNNYCGSHNFASGCNALQFSRIGCHNFAQGYDALRCNGYGNNNFAQGQSALYNNLRGNNNVGIGFFAMIANSCGNNNIAIGCQSLRFNTNGCGNIAQGYKAMYGNTTGNGNIALGGMSLVTNTSGVNNVAIGCAALIQNSRGTANVAVGCNALYGTTTSFNTAIGACAGTNNTTGCNNTFLGNGAVGSAPSSINAVTFGNSAVTTLRAAVTTITALSDCRDKTNIAGIPIGLDFLREIRPVQFDWNSRDGAKVGVPEMGFIAQELDALQQKYGVESALGLVLKDNPDKLEATPGKLLPVIIKAIQELATIVDQLAAK